MKEKLKVGFRVFYTFSDIKKNEEVIERKKGEARIVQVRSKDFIILTDEGKRIYCSLPVNKKDRSQSYTLLDNGFINTYHYKSSGDLIATQACYIITNI